MAFGQYKGRCIGRLMRFLYDYCIKSAECIFHGENEDPMITLYGEPFANYIWDGDSDIPTFTFLGEYEYLNKVQERKKEYILELFKLAEELFGKKK